MPVIAVNEVADAAFVTSVAVKIPTIPTPVDEISYRSVVAEPEGSVNATAA